jgi:hypothetical protein
MARRLSYLALAALALIDVHPMAQLAAAFGHRFTSGGN